jgi:3-hydroxyisobutyrate dehydrogenase
MRLGLVGLGKMGLAIAARLAEQGVEVTGWDADPSRLAELTQLGHAAAGSAAEVAESAECVISIIFDDLAGC